MRYVLWFFLLSTLSGVALGQAPHYSAAGWKKFERDEIRDSKSKIRLQMKDPDAAKFGDVWVQWILVDMSKLGIKNESKGLTDIPTVCGFVNGKNSYGGYVGMRRFMGYDIEPTEDEEGGINTREIFDQNWAKQCVAGARHHR